MKVPATCSQTVGPFFSIGLTKLSTPNLVGPGVEGVIVIIQGQVLDGDGQPVDDAMIETWQADASGRYHHPEDVRDLAMQSGFRGFGRVTTNDAGAFSWATIKPGRVPGPNGTLQAPHIVVAVAMRGLLKHLLTRVYFPDESCNAEDPILQLVEPERWSTLIARNVRGREGVLEWNVICQGTNETVFFDY